MITVSGKHNLATVFTDNAEPSCLDQVRILCDQEWANDSKIRIMPDCHAGKGCVIGTTMTVKDKVVPNLVGVDVGCGVLCSRIRRENIDFPFLDDTVRRLVPMGFSIHQEKIADFSKELDKLSLFKEKADYSKINRSIGTLGGGNHYLELGESSDSGDLFLTIHTGSRNFGKMLAEFYQGKAKEYHGSKTGRNHAEAVKEIVERLTALGRTDEIQMEIESIPKCPPSGMEYLEGDLFDAYINDMKIAQRYASLNRSIIADRVIGAMGFREIGRFESVHNYIDTDDMILRKGAISARDGEICIIPINMRDGALLCLGRGNPDFNYSAPHGAGRLMSRSQAKETITLEDFKSQMDGIYTTSISTATLDEAPGAYKPIDEIKANIRDAVDIVEQVKPLYNLKV